MSTTASTASRSSTGSDGSTPGSLLDDPVAGPTPGHLRHVRGRRHALASARATVGDHGRPHRAVGGAGRRPADELPAGGPRAAVRTATTPSDDPVASDRELHTRMRRAEGELASALAADAFVVADGPLNDRSRRSPVVGYIKSHRVTYLPPEQNAVVAELAPGQRTPLFTIADYQFRYSWYVRLAMLPGGHSWTGIVRCEASRPAPARTTCAAIADRTAAILPTRRAPSRTSTRARRRTSCRSRALERELRHRMGDPRLVYRALRDAVMRTGGLVSERPGRPGPRVGASTNAARSAWCSTTTSTSSSTTSWSCARRSRRPARSATYGVVTEAEAVYEGATFESDTHRDRRARHHAGGEGALRARRRHARRPRDLGLPRPRRGRRARHRRRARRRPCTPTRWAGRCRSGLGRDGAPVHVDLDFFDGRKGGHMSISGISGVATKTSFALFFLRMLTASPSVRGRGRREPARAGLQREGRGPALARQAEPPLRRRGRRGVGGARRRARAVPERCGSGRRPAGAPATSSLPDTGGRQEGVDVFSWTPREFIDEDLPAVPVHRRERREEPDPVRPRTRAGAVEAVRRRRGRACRARSCCAIPPHRTATGAASRSRRSAGERIVTRPAVARRRPRRVPGARGRLRARLGVERPGDGRARSPRSCGGCTRAPSRIGHARAGPARAAASTARRRASPSSRSSRCTTRRSGSWSARC